MNLKTPKPNFELNHSYSIITWFITIGLGSIFITLSSLNFHNTSNLLISEVISTFLIFLLFSAIFSLPVLFTHYILLRVLYVKAFQVLTIKVILTFLAIISIMVSLLLIGGSISANLIIAYCLAGLLAHSLTSPKARDNPTELSKV